MILFQIVATIIGCVVVIKGQDPANSVTSSSTPAPDWNYEHPTEWKEHFSSCGGAHQSPINLNLSQAIAEDYPRFHFHNYDRVFPEMVTNNGHTVMMRLGSNQNRTTEEDLPFINGGGLSGRFNFFQLHFHWGKDPMRGSEHLLNDWQYSAELHMVHYNAKYGSFNEAVPHPDGLAVLGIVMELEARDNIAFRHLEHFDDIVNPDANKNSTLSYSIPLVDLLPDRTGSFYRYNGSLTTPGCNEDVIWTIFDTPIGISERQLRILRKLHDTQGHEMENNFRPVQELHDRVLTYRPEDRNLDE
ncbi:alpha-carbonic anhydrase [Daphnia pulex]|uniref:Carbonic anhydrase n=1 Tax=Daphnia pulex TaxID=6669 RepID=E9FXL4_DAPPU|nr:alpha-carbonic anhydrase [Daphnia pulex]|eukprot:EFX88104.1 alpha-carbonic anhydrase [Daphnia pulex]